MALSLEKKVGIFFLVTLILLGVIIELVEGWTPFDKKDNYHAFFPTAIGIRMGDPVRLSGVEVGKIQKIGIEENQVRVDFSVREGTAIRTDSFADIQQTNFLGGHFLGISFGTPASPLLPPGSAVPTRDSVSIGQLIANLNTNQERVLGELGNLIEETRSTFTDSINRLNAIVVKIDEGKGTLGKLVNDQTLYDELQGSLTGFHQIMNRISKGEGTLGRLLEDPALYEDAKKTLANLRNISDNIAKGEGTLGKLMNDSQLYEDTRIAMEKIKNIAAKIDQGDGTLGRLVNDESLYLDARTTLKKVEQTVDGMSDTGPLSALGVVVGTLF